MLIRWIGDARACLGASRGPGEVFDVPDADGLSLIEQGKAEAYVSPGDGDWQPRVILPPPVAPKVFKKGEEE